MNSMWRGGRVAVSKKMVNFAILSRCSLFLYRDYCCIIVDSVISIRLYTIVFYCQLILLFRSDRNTAKFEELASILLGYDADYYAIDCQMTPEMIGEIYGINYILVKDDGFDGGGEMDDGAAGGACRRLGGVWR